MESVTCCLSTWVTGGAHPSARSPWAVASFFWVCRKQISEHLSYIALKTFVPGQGSKIPFHALGQLNF